MAMTERYLYGRSRKTFQTYKLAFCKLWVHLVKIGKSMFNWNEMDVAGHLVLIDENKASVNIFMQSSAVITLLKEVVGLETMVELRLVAQVKKGCMKRSRDGDGMRRFDDIRNVIVDDIIVWIEET